MENCPGMATPRWKFERIPARSIPPNPIDWLPGSASRTDQVASFDIGLWRWLRSAKGYLDHLDAERVEGWDEGTTLFLGLHIKYISVPEALQKTSRWLKVQARRIDSGTNANMATRQMRRDFQRCDVARFFEQWSDDLWQLTGEQIRRFRPSRRTGKRGRRPDEAVVPFDPTRDMWESLAEPSAGEPSPRDLLLDDVGNLPQLLLKAADCVYRDVPYPATGQRLRGLNHKERLPRSEKPPRRDTRMKIFVSSRAVAVAMARGDIGLKDDNERGPDVDYSARASSFVKAIMSVVGQALTALDGAAANVHYPARYGGQVLFLLEQVCAAEGLHEFADHFADHLGELQRRTVVRKSKTEQPTEPDPPASGGEASDAKDFEVQS